MRAANTTAKAGIIGIAPTSVHIPTLEELMAPYAHLPMTVQDALLRLETHPAFRILSDTTHRILKALLTRADKRDGRKPITARNDRLAVEAYCSTKSVKRAIDQFYALGWLHAASDGRDQNGKYSKREYLFGAGLIELVRLPVPCHLEQLRPDALGLPDNRTSEPDFRAEQRMDAMANSDSAPRQIILPVELKAMAETHGISESGVCMLRGLAHKHGYRLQDVYGAIAHHMVTLGLRATRAFNYYRRCILNPKKTDYAGKAAQMDRLAQDAVQGARKRSHAGKRFTGAGGIFVKIFDGWAEIVKGDGTISQVVGTDLAELYDQIERGQLTPGNTPIQATNGSRPDTARLATLAAVQNLQRTPAPLPATSSPLISTVALRYRQFIDGNDALVRVFDGAGQRVQPDGQISELDADGLAQLAQDYAAGVLQEIDGAQASNFMYGRTLKAKHTIANSLPVLRQAERAMNAARSRLDAQLMDSLLPSGKQDNLRMMRKLVGINCPISSRTA
ncbi:hypothetical protein AAKU55_005555 [Oxalobacteraceae bacterium GrIS 1.11]